MGTFDNVFQLKKEVSIYSFINKFTYLEYKDVIGKSSQLSRILLSSDDVKLPLKFPIKQTCAITINISQGQTFDCIGNDFHKEVFDHWKLYVALSRAIKFSAESNNIKLR